jgi:hypothetical protein
MIMRDIKSETIEFNLNEIQTFLLCLHCEGIIEQPTFKYLNDCVDRIRQSSRDTEEE